MPTIRPQKNESGCFAILLSIFADTMLQPPHTRYDRLFVYYFDRRDLAPVNDPDLIGVWIEDDHAVLFFHRAKEALVADICSRHNCSLIYQAELDYLDWEAGVAITSFCTKYLQVRPVWEAGGTDGVRQEIVLDPSVIFGSGFHPSTRLCLETLELLCCDAGTRIDSVLDLGTGTGLLAIAAARLGAGRVRALDYNPLAVAVARANVERNQVQGQVQVEPGNLLEHIPDTTCDLVIANLYKGLLAHLLAAPEFWHARWYLISGFLPGMEAELLAALGDRKVRMRHRGSSGPWRLWLLEREQAG